MEENYYEVSNKTNVETKPISNVESNSGSNLYKITNNQLEMNNSEIPEKPPQKFSQKCCNYICSKFCNSNKRSKNFYMKGWRDYLEREGNDASDKPFKILTNLFVNDEEAIMGLESIRLNPNLVSENKLRNDLEFYIPQLCTFLLFGEMKDIEEFFVFLCKACNLSFFFAHRVHWFLSAMIEASKEKKDNIIQILKMINTLFKSENEENKVKLNKFYVSNSEPFIRYIKINNLYFLYNNKNIQNDRVDIIEEIDKENLKGHQLDIYNKFSKTKELISKFSEKEYEYVIFKDKNIAQNTDSDKNNIKNEINDNEIKEEKDKSDLKEFNQKLNANEFLISISNFKLNKIDYSYEDEDDDDLNDDNDNNINNEEKIIKEKIRRPVLDINFESYHSSLNFIDHLCDVCDELTKYNIDFQKIFLYNKLLEINKKLPCNVYLPFLKESTRNYIICHIPLDSVKIFRTKTRCPIMLTFELIRINEVNKANEDEENYPSFHFSYSNENPEYSKKLTLLEKKINSSYDKNMYSNTDYDLSKPLMISKKSEEIDKNSKKNTFKINTFGKKFYPSTNLKLFAFPGKAKTSSINNLEDSDLEEDSNTKYMNYVNKFLKSPVKPKHMNFDKINEKNLKEKILNPNDIDKNNDKDKEIITSNNKKKVIFNSVIGLKTKNIKPEKKLEEKLIDNEESPEEINIGGKTKKLNNSENMKMNTEEDNKPISIDDLKKIFGEPFKDMEKKLKKKSLFGNLNTYKIFSCIIKTNEDLRQEQFATQLINEFFQIFKLENTGCWLNTYEIISTGNNSGLVEMVNDSISLDQLKQKTNHMSLKNFYKNYFGNGNEESLLYKKAMTNFVSSLAGYSLVCYFLQIKDRHNGNILIDNEGHIIHIDFGFLLSNAPGKGLKFENAPFKLSKDMVEALGGVKGKYFMEFRKLLKKGFLAVHKHRSKIIILVEMMWCGHGKKLGCFEGGQETIDALKKRLNPKDYISKKNIRKLVDDLIGQSVDNWRTKWYDIFQYYVQGIFY